MLVDNVEMFLNFNIPSTISCSVLKTVLLVSMDFKRLGSADELVSLCVGQLLTL